MVREHLHRNLVEIVRRRDGELAADGVSPAAAIAAKLMAVGVDIVKLGDLVSSLLGVANCSGLNSYFGEIVRVSAEFGDDEHEAETICLVNQLAAFTKSEAIFGEVDLLHKVMVCLVGSAFHFSSDGNFDAKLMLKWSAKSDKVDAMSRDTLFKIISLAIVKNSRKMNEALLSVFEKIAKANFAFQIEKKNKDLLKSSWTKIVHLMRNILAKDSNEDMEVVAHTFFSILAFEAVRLFDSFKESSEVVEDLTKAYEKAVDVAGGEKKKGKKAKKVDSEDEPKWIDIVVEMLLSLYTLNSRWIRNAVGVVFKRLVPLMSEDSVQLLLELLEPQADAELLVDEEIGADGDVEEENGKAEGDDDEESGIEEDDSDDEDDAAEDDFERMNRLDEELKKAVNDALGDAAAQDSEQSDLDDDAMMQLDEALGQAFKARKRDKQREVDVVQYKAKVLDLVQEVFRCTQRIDLIVFSIQPMLDILFESQKKSNLKAISQRIISLFNNFKNIRKFTDSKLPKLDELFELLQHVISSSVTHFNATPTLIEISSFLVRLIQTVSASLEASEKEATQQRLNDVYLTLIKNFYSQNETKVNPAIHKEYLIRFPSVSLPLAQQMIECALMPDVKLHKKTLTLITLYQAVNNQMFAELAKDTVNQFMCKIFEFFTQLINKIIEDESVHVKFVDAFLNLVGRVLNLQASLIDKDLIEKLASSLTQFNKESKVKQAYKSRSLNLIHTCHSKFGVAKTNEDAVKQQQQKKAKKRKSDAEAPVNGEQHENKINAIEKSKKAKLKISK